LRPLQRSNAEVSECSNGKGPLGGEVGRKEMFLAIIQLCSLFLSQKTVQIRDQLFLYTDTGLTKRFVLDISITF
jgi:hypothetical protein